MLLPTRQFFRGNGFTLIELLIVIAVLGVLAAGVLVAINPGEQLARARDASRKTTVGQLSRAAQAYYTSQQKYPAGDPFSGVAGTWITQLVGAGEIKSVPTNPDYSLANTGPCERNIQGGYCYASRVEVNTEAMIFVKMESSSERRHCGLEANMKTYLIWQSKNNNGNVGYFCVNTGDSPWDSTAGHPLVP